MLATNNGVPSIRSEISQKFLPISDDEFLARCKPGTDPEVALKVRAIISEQLGIPANEIHPEHRFIEDLGAD